MTLKEFMENIEGIVKNNPDVLEMEVVTSIDDEGNGFNKVYIKPTLGYYDADDEEFYNENDEDEDMNPNNAICVN